MLSTVKKRLYFVVATYFIFWARIILKRWKPRIIVITGSTGKTTLLHLVEAQLGDKATYSHHFNSSFGLPFHLLGLGDNVESIREWFWRLSLAPFRIFRKTPETKIYVVEADTDRPKEGKFLGKFLDQEVTLWTNVSNTHGMNFDYLVDTGKFPDQRTAIAHDFGDLVAATQKLVVVNEDLSEVMSQINRLPSDVRVEKISMKKITDYKMAKDNTIFKIDNQTISLPGLHPKEIGLGLQQVNVLLDYLSVELDPNYEKFETPPGRNNILRGKNNVTILDSTYNTALVAMQVVIKLLDDYSAKGPKWLVIGDILEQGKAEQDQHKKLAKTISDLRVDHVVFLGPRTRKYTYPIAKEKLSVPVVSFESPKEVLDYLKANLKGGETILFKGGRFLEGVIEQLLDNPADANKLVRREKTWIKRRQKWGLPR